MSLDMLSLDTHSTMRWVVWRWRASTNWFSEETRQGDGTSEVGMKACKKARDF